ncbi:Protein dehydration-induced 19, C-terminal [Sesbania bispinosa]|nr:Protein dehydration-induced 19, C-terminal [Sesbania bispinosa]
MEGENLSFGLSTASRSYESRLKSHFELFIDFDEVNGDDELSTVYPCAFCAEDFDLVELCCHIDLDHPIEAKSGICPVCAVHISKFDKDDSYSTLSFSRKDQLDGHWQSFSAGLPPVMSTSKTDPFLSFLCGAAAANERQKVQPDSSSSEVSIEETHSDDKMLERDVQPSLSDKDHIEKARRSEYVQGLLMSTMILDPDF